MVLCKIGDDITPFDGTVPISLFYLDDGQQILLNQYLILKYLKR
jgi:hypothetical protein